MTKAPTPTEMSKGQVTTQTTSQKSSIKQRLRTDLGRSVGITKATQLVWLTGLRAHLPTNRNSRVIKRTKNGVYMNTLVEVSFWTSAIFFWMYESNNQADFERV